MGLDSFRLVCSFFAGIWSFTRISKGSGVNFYIPCFIIYILSFVLLRHNLRPTPPFRLRLRLRLRLNRNRLVRFLIACPFSPSFALPSFSPIGRCRRTGTRGLYRYLLLLPHQSKSFVDSKKNSAAFGRISHLPGSPPPTTSNASPLYIFPPPTDLLSIFRPSRSNIRYRPLPIASAASRICTHRNRPSPLYGRPKLTYSYQSETLFVLASRPCWNP